MRGISELRRGRSLQTRAKKSKIRRRKPALAAYKILSEFKARPRREFRSRQPYLGTDVNVADLLR